MGMSYHNRLWRVLNTLNEQELGIELGGTINGLASGVYRQEFILLQDGHLYEIGITKEELKLSDQELRAKILHKLRFEKYRA